MKKLCLVGVTGKKSGGVLAQHLGDNLETIRKIFPDGISTVVRATSDTSKLEQRIPDIEKYIGSITDMQLLKKAFNGVDTLIHVD